MFESLEEDKPKEPQPTNYTGLIVLVITLPVFLLFRHFGRLIWRFRQLFTSE